MPTIHQSFRTSYTYDVHFTAGVFDAHNELLGRIIESGSDPVPHEILIVLDDGLLAHYPGLSEQIYDYFANRPSLAPASEPVIVPGGEAAKNDPALVDRLHRAIYEAGLCRHSYVLAVGGGAVIDLAGYAAATAHRGVRLIRIPTTVLAQNDSAVGVKNGVNRFNVKNFLGAFAPPFAVVNDSAFLHTLDDRDWRSGISEAVKVALLKDPEFFDEIEANASALSPRERRLEPMQHLIRRCAELHLEHIATSGDPFEMGSSRPLDFGHWAAHQLEQLTDYRLRHGEAVAIGIALDTTYSHLQGLFSASEWERTIQLFEQVGFDVYVPELDEHIDEMDHPRCLFRGLEIFREHLGGQLTIMLLEGIGRGVEVHDVDHDVYRNAIEILRDRQATAPCESNAMRDIA